MTSVPDFRSAAGWAALGPMLVGAAFLWSGAIKAVAPHVFREHVGRLGMIPARATRYVVSAAAGFETAWGLVLTLGVFAGTVLPLTALLLVAFTGVTWWSVKSGRTTDCGCYGGYVVPSTAQSLMLNGTFIALVVIAWLVIPSAGQAAPWQLIAIGATAIGFAAFAEASQRFLLKNGKKLIETSPLKVGRRWSKRWGTNVPDDGRETLVSYLGPDCPYCQQWVRVLNAMDQSPGLPRVIGIVAASQEKLETFIQSSGIRFPVATIPQTLMSRLVWGVPTTVLISSASIEKHWSGLMPPDFFVRFREAFFPEMEVRDETHVETAT